MPIAIHPAPEEELVPAGQAEPDMPPWQADMQYMRRVSHAIMNHIVGEMKPPFLKDPPVKALGYTAAFGNKEAPAHAFMAAGAFLMKLHECDARLRASESADGLALPPGAPITEAEVEILRRFVERMG